MKDITKEKLTKELLDVQQKFDALKLSNEKTINELNNSLEWNKNLLSSLPHPAMYIRAKDRIVIAVNGIASDMGVKIGGHCWREFTRIRISFST